MAKKDQTEEQGKEESTKTDFVKLVREASQAMGASTFTRVNLGEHITDEGLEALNEEFGKEGYEVFSNAKSAVLIKQ